MQTATAPPRYECSDDRRRDLRADRLADLEEKKSHLIRMVEAGAVDRRTMKKLRTISGRIVSLQATYEGKP